MCLSSTICSLEGWRRCFNFAGTRRQLCACLFLLSRLRSLLVSTLPCSTAMLSAALVVEAESPQGTWTAVDVLAAGNVRPFLGSYLLKEPEHAASTVSLTELWSLVSSICSRCWSTPFNRPLQCCTQTFTLTLGYRFYVATREATTTVTVLAAAAAKTQQFKRRRLSEPEAQPGLPTGPSSAKEHAAKAQPASFTPTDVPFGLLRVRGLAPGGNAYAYKDCACVGG